MSIGIDFARSGRVGTCRRDGARNFARDRAPRHENATKGELMQMATIPLCCLSGGMGGYGLYEGLNIAFAHLLEV